MVRCPFCDRELREKTGDCWTCECGEEVPFGMELDDEQNCARCPVSQCPRRK